MDMKRRQFLKIAGLSTIAGIGAPSAFRTLLDSQATAFASSKPEAATHGGSAAASGTRYGMIIDQRKFAAEKGLAEKCIKACHITHNVPQFPDKKDEIKWIWKTPFENAFTTESQQFKNEGLGAEDFLVLCNHCENPSCVRVCPTKATYKNKDGIVLMDYHRCIGCRFCMAACPYGSRSFNWRDPRPFINKATYNPEFPTRMRGVVEKCNFCVERLAKGLQPACVEATGHTGALVFGNLNDPESEIRQVLKQEFTIQRKPEVGTNPSVFYII